jgi:hypothetical protein
MRRSPSLRLAGSLSGSFPNLIRADSILLTPLSTPPDASRAMWSNGLPVGATAVASEKLGSPWGLRHAASALSWYDTLSPVERKQAVRALTKAKAATKVSGRWQVAKTSDAPPEAKEQATIFMGGFGTLFSDRHPGHPWALLPNHLYFLVDFMHCSLKVRLLMHHPTI